MARGEHRAWTIQQPRREIQLIGRRQPDPHHVKPLRHDSFGKRRRQRWRARPHVMADHHLRCAVANQPRERAADIGDETFVELLADQSANVIRLDDAMNSRRGPRHGAPCERDRWRQPNRRLAGG
jgi:hypothetical protein